MQLILFVCHANVTRSQMAAAFFNADAPTGWRALSAGTDVKTEDGLHSADSRMLYETPATIHIFAAMDEYGIDMRNNKRHQITPELIANAHTIISLVPPEICPDFMHNNPTITYWDVADVESVTALEFKKIRDRVRPLVLACTNKIRETQKLT